MDLPTYTNIWRIEKRLYKLYDLRLPMPLPLVQIGVFLGVFVPWILLLRFVGIPFKSPWHVLYIVPPGVLTWLATRPVIEGKRLTELLLSQTRYLAEPRTWCRLTPIREPREVVVVARVWRRAEAPAPVAAPERAAVKSRRRARKAAAEPAPAAAAAAAVVAPPPAPVPAAAPMLPGPAIADGPVPLADYAARFDVPAPAAPVAPAAPAAPAPPAAPAAPAPKPWRRTDRDISHEDDVQLEPHLGEFERPPATPRLEVPPSSAGSGKRGLASGIRRPGASAEIWPAVSPSTRPDIPQQAPAAPASFGRPVPFAKAETPAPPPPPGQAPGVHPVPLPFGAGGTDGPTAQQGRPEEPQAPGEETPATTSAASGPAEAGPSPSAQEPVAEAGARAADRPDDGAAENAPAGQETGHGDAARATESPAPAEPAEADTAVADEPAPPAPETRHEAEPETPDARADRPAPVAPAESPADAAAKPTEAEAAGAAPEPAAPVAGDAERPAAAQEAERGDEAGSPVERPAPVASSESSPTPAGRDDTAERPAAVVEPMRGRRRGRKGAELFGGEPGDKKVAGWQAASPRRAPAPPPQRPAPQQPVQQPVQQQPPAAQGPTRPDLPRQVPQRGGPGAPAQPPVVRPPAPTRPDIPMQGRPAAPAAFGGTQGGPPEENEWRPAKQERDAGTPRLEAPRPWSKGLSKPLRPATTDNMQWPPVPEPGKAPEAYTELPPQGVPIQPPPQPPQQLQPPQPHVPQPAEEQAPPREVRSQPQSPVRPRPLPPPPAPPASGPAITPPGPEHEVTTGGLRRLIQAVGGGHGEVDAEYQQRLQQPFHGTRHVVVLGCTGGAGQTVTALMLGHTFAQHNGEPVVAIDVNPGPGALARRTRSETNETLTSLITRADQVGSLTAMRRYTSQAKSGLDVIAAGKNPLQALDDRDYALAIRTIDKFYSVTLLDTAAAIVARVLPYADQIVLVAPASADAPRAVAMTFEWLDGHGYEELRSRAVTVINGVSRRSMDDVEQAEAVARGRCRALVRIPWDDHLSMDRAPRNELKSLRAPTRRAYLALAGVVAGGFTVVPERYQELQQEQEATR
ncbi:TcpE family conjugal transfer membrane protein [Actinomadura nitritigenes]|uniref:TcpE family conjugal transfer membrane protein n=1 Tax=Actinomadura nitritigenes TaxID=134602 RepID=UPI0036A607FE